MLNGAFSWPKTGVALQLADGVDELSVAAVLDAYPRTFAAVARGVSPGRAPVVSRHGLLLVPVATPGEARADLVILPNATADRFFAFDRVLADIATRYDGDTAALAAAQLEYAADRLPHDVRHLHRAAASPSAQRHQSLRSIEEKWDWKWGGASAPPHWRIPENA